MDKRAQTIRSMFSEVAGAYDQTNTILSFGIHHLWKQKIVNLTPLKQGDNVLDCATGTGDLAILYKRKVGPNGQVVGTDFCQEMLDHAPAKAEKENLDIQFKLEDVTKLSFQNNQFNACSISFGIRNVENLTAALNEMARVTKPGGYVMILEFGQVYVPGIKQAYNFYSEKVLPKLGGLVSGKTDAYQYLNDSSQAFPSGDEFKALIMNTQKYRSVEVKPLSLGVAYIYKCQVL